MGGENGNLIQRLEQRLDARIGSRDIQGSPKLRYVGVALAIEGISCAARKISNYFKDVSDGEKIMKK